MGRNKFRSLDMELHSLDSLNFFLTTAVGTAFEKREGQEFFSMRQLYRPDSTAPSEELPLLRLADYVDERFLRGGIDGTGYERAVSVAMECLEQIGTRPFYELCVPDGADQNSVEVGYRLTYSSPMQGNVLEISLCDISPSKT